MSINQMSFINVFFFFISMKCQVAAADKQLRSTRQFLEEQAYEREAERDEAAIKIKLLQEQLKERERDKERDLRISSEVSQLYKLFFY